METTQGGEAVVPADTQSFTDIQSYLANFNKEIDPSGQTIFLAAPGGTGDGQTPGGLTAVSFTSQDQLFAASQVGVEAGSGVDQPLITADPSTSQPHTMVLQGPDGNAVQVIAAPGVSGAVNTSIPQPITSLSTTNPQLVAVQSQSGSQPQLVAVQNQPHLVQQQAIDQSQVAAAEQDQSGSGDQQQSVVLNTGNSYQTVTIVPSEVNQGGEVSYVLIVSQPEDEKNADMSVYDFKEEKGMVDSDEEGYEEGGTQKRAPKQTPRKLGGNIQTQLMCNYCNYTSPKRYLLTRHMKTHSEERPHKCHICDRGFKTVASLQNHINTHTGVRPHKCKECDAAFTTSGELVRHVRYRHTFEKPHKCSECDYSSVELSKLKRHMRSHTGERPYQCPHCSYASPDTYKLKRHLRIHTGEKPYECEHCHARFTQSNSLKAHRLIHSGTKPVYQCELCPTTCGRKTDLKIHVQKLHTADVPLQCKKCGKSFPDRYTYKIHTKTHEGEKCFRCELCPYAALSQRHLESHILTHTGERPFDCDECDQSFRQKQLLKRHKNLYHTPDYVAPAPRDKMHECGECHKTFAHKGNLLRHMAIHDPDNPLYSKDDIVKAAKAEKITLIQVKKFKPKRINFREIRVIEVKKVQENILVKEEGLMERVVHPEEPEEEEEEEEEPTEMVPGGEATTQVGYIQNVDADGNYVRGQQVQVQLVSPDGTQTGQILVQIDGNQQTIAMPTMDGTQQATISMPQMQAQLAAAGIDTSHSGMVHQTAEHGAMVMATGGYEGQQVIQTQADGETVLIVPQGVAPGQTIQTADGQLIQTPHREKIQVPRRQIVAEPHIIVRHNQIVGGDLVGHQQVETEEEEGVQEVQMVTEDMVEVLHSDQIAEEDEEMEDEEIGSPDSSLTSGTPSPRKSPRKPKVAPVPEEMKKKNIETCFGFEDME